MTLARKILIGFISCTFILLAVALFSLRNSEKLVETNKWVNHTHEVLFEFDQLQLNSLNAIVGARGFAFTGNTSYLEPFNMAKSSIFDHVKKVRELTVDNPIQQKNIDSLEVLATADIDILNKIIDIRQNDPQSSKFLIEIEQGKIIEDKIKKIVTAGQQIEQRLLLEREQASAEDYRSFNAVFVVLLIVIVAILLSVFWIINVNLKALKKAEEETAGKNWSLAGTSNLVRGMQGNKQVEELTQTIVSHLASYLNAQTGVIYLADEHAFKLNLSGVYASGKDYTEAGELKFGEGLAGQAAAENKTIICSDIPDGHLNIKTGFGDLKPKSIIVVPFSFEGKVIGVVELGSIYPFSRQQQEFIDIVSDSIAIAITSAQIREKTKELLEETQRQAEELEQQQEELRMANEELLAKTELLVKSEGSLKAQQEELQQINEELEEKAGLLEEQKAKLEDAKNDIEAKAKEIEQTSRYKSEFLANMSHELRTPLNSILILSQLLSENNSGKLGAKEMEFARNIFNSGNDLLDLINEILDLSKVESGKMELEIEEVPLEHISSNLAPSFGEMAKNRSIHFKMEQVGNDLPTSVTTDRQRLEQILKNLLSNAFKFTPADGNISLTIGRPAAGTVFKARNLIGTNNVMAFAVRDSGIGIPKEKRAIIFEAFQQADGSTKRKYGGTGLGLSISRELAGILGGEIQLDSEVGKGSTFTLFLPDSFNPDFVMSESKQVEIKIRETTPQAPVTTKIMPVAPLQNIIEPQEQQIDDRNNVFDNDRVILIIEDDPNFARLLLDFVRQRNYKGIIATSGNVGLSLARHYRPAAILLDMRLPVMDGTDVLKHIKNDPNLRHIPIQILSALDLRKQSLELGAFDYLRKPVTSSSVQKALDKIEKFVSKKLKKLLIVEDNRNHNIAISELIANSDVQCFSAFSGNEALQMMLKDNFDSVIVDLGLPDMSGIQLLETIKSNEKLNQVPIIVYTGRELNKEENAQLAKLADTVVLKTANSQERLLDETVLFLHQVEAKLSKEKQTILRKLHKADEVLINKKVLLVDDDIRNIYSLTNVLEEQQVICIIAENGKIAIKELQENPDIDLVLMDVMMPEMDGFEATTEIRKMEQYQNLPIIALTAKAMKGDKERCLAVGMSDYISKPVNIEQLLSLMHVWLYK